MTNGHLKIFFQPSQLILELPDLLKHAIPLFLVCFLLGSFAAAEDLGQFAQRLFLPLANQVGMHPKLARQFVDRFLFADGFQSYSRLEVCAEAAPLSCHSWLLFCY